MENIAEIPARACAMPRFEDGAINLQELIRRLAEDLANGIMDAEADQMCEATGNSRNGYRTRTLKTCVGELSLHIADAAERAGMDSERIVRAGSISEVFGDLDICVEPGDAVLVKASHFMGLERVVEGLVN